MMGKSSEGEEESLGEDIGEEEVESEEEEEESLGEDMGEEEVESEEEKESGNSVKIFSFAVTSSLLLDQEFFTLLNGAWMTFFPKYGTKVSSSQDFYKNKKYKLIWIKNFYEETYACVNQVIISGF